MGKKATSNKGKAWLKREMRPYRASIAFVTVLSVLSTIAALLFAYTIQFLVAAAEEKNEQTILLVSIILLGILALKIFMRVLYGYCGERLCSRMLSEQRTSVFGKILRSNYASVGEYHSGDLLTRITSDLSEVVVSSVGLPASLVGMAVQCVGAIAALATLDPLFTAIYVLCGVIGGALTGLLRKRVKALHKGLMKIDGESRSFMQEGLASLLTIKAYNAEEKVAQKADDYSEKYYRARLKRNVLRTIMNSSMHILSNVGLIFAVIWCSIRLMSGMEFGAMLSIVLLLNQLQHPFSAISNVIPTIFSRQASAERLDEITSVAEETSIVQETLSADEVQGFSLTNVSFDYGREKVLQDVSLSVENGESICIVGNSGSGKSTLFKLLLGVYKPTSGEMVLSKKNGDRVDYAAKPKDMFAYVPQGNFLFSGTIKENLLFFAKGDVAEDEIKDALTIAQAEFVYELPDGIETVLSERGAGLSEGQQQRLAIARALLSNRPVLLLDEATSALDSETEGKLLSAIKALEGKTCIMVTHRPAALALADRVYRILDGTIEVL